jgi:hypothetical protein
LHPTLRACLAYGPQHGLASRHLLHAPVIAGPGTQPPGSSRPSCQRAPCSRFDSDDSDAPPHSPRSPHGRQARTPIVVVLVQHLILQKRPYDRGATSTPWGRTTGGPPRRHGPPYRSRRPYRPPASPSTEGTLRNEHGAGGEGQPQPPRCSPSGDTTGSNPPEQLNFLQSNSRERGKVRLAAKAVRLGGFGTFAPGASSTPFQYNRHSGHNGREPYERGQLGTPLTGRTRAVMQRTRTESSPPELQHSWPAPGDLPAVHSPNSTGNCDLRPCSA